MKDLPHKCAVTVMWPANDQWRIFSGAEVPREDQTSSKDPALMVAREDCQSISKIDDFVKHVYRKHNQEADHWANTGAGTRTEENSP